MSGITNIGTSLPAAVINLPESSDTPEKEGGAGFQGSVCV